MQARHDAEAARDQGIVTTALTLLANSGHASMIFVSQTRGAGMPSMLSARRHGEDRGHSSTTPSCPELLMAA